MRRARREKGYEELRGLCEIVVEHEMFKGIVQRYTPNVMMTKLDKLNVEKFEETTKAIMAVFDRCCRSALPRSSVRRVRPRSRR